VRRVADAPNYLFGAIFSFAMGLVLIVYGCWFWKKMKRLRLIR
jgi:hypothetical protein